MTFTTQCGREEIILDSDECLCLPGIFSEEESFLAVLFPLRMSFMCCTISPIATEKKKKKTRQNKKHSIYSYALSDSTEPSMHKHNFTKQLPSLLELEYSCAFALLCLCPDTLNHHWIIRLVRIYPFWEQHTVLVQLRQQNNNQPMKLSRFDDQSHHDKTGNQKRKYHHLMTTFHLTLRWLPLRYSKHQSPTTVFLKTFPHLDDLAKH